MATLSAIKCVTQSGHSSSCNIDACTLRINPLCTSMNELCIEEPGCVPLTNAPQPLTSSTSEPHNIRQVYNSGSGTRRFGCLILRKIQNKKHFPTPSLGVRGMNVNSFFRGARALTDLRHLVLVLHVECGYGHWPMLAKNSSRKCSKARCLWKCPVPVTTLSCDKRCHFTTNLCDEWLRQNSTPEPPLPRQPAQHPFLKFS